MKYKYKIAFLSPTPSQYFPELYQKIALNQRIDLTMLFCSKAAIDGTELQKKYAVKDKDWGTDLLAGYKYKFLKNYSFWRLQDRRFLSYVNPEIWHEIKHGNYDVIIIQLWRDITWWITPFICKHFGVPFIYMSDSTTLTDLSKSRWKLLLKQIFLGKVFFPLASAFLCSGTGNKNFYLHYGVPEEKLFPFPHSTDNEKLIELARELKPVKNKLRLRAGVDENKFVILFVGRLAEEKRPMDLLKAKVHLGKKCSLIFVGDGPLKAALKEYTSKHGLCDVHFVGFQKRNNIPEFYALADLLVLPSSYDTWGLVVNEAMCFGLPVIVSDKVGAGLDLIHHNENGYIYPCRNIKSLVSYIKKIMDNNNETQARFSKKSLQIIMNWGHRQAIDGLLKAADFVYKG